MPPHSRHPHVSGRNDGARTLPSKSTYCVAAMARDTFHSVSLATPNKPARKLQASSEGEAEAPRSGMTHSVSQFPNS